MLIIMARLAADSPGDFLAEAHAPVVMSKQFAMTSHSLRVFISDLGRDADAVKSTGDLHSPAKRRES